MQMTRRTLLTSATAVTLAGLGSLALSACGRDAGPTGSGSASAGGADGAASLAGQVKGAGASSQADAQDAWMNTFLAANPQAGVEYAAEGSGAGREKFLAGAVDFAGSDSAMSQEEIAQAGDVVEVPLYISPIAVAFNLPGLAGTHLNMTPQVLAQVFAGSLTTWNDPALAELNPDVDLPALPIVVVHRSDESGTTKSFTRYLSTVAPETWTWKASETWPIEGGQSGDGTSGMVATIAGAEGAIGYADASKVDGTLGAVAIGSDGTFAPYSPQAAAATLDASELSPQATDTGIVYDINYQAAGTYPIILVSYLIARQSYPAPELAATVKGYLAYAASEEGQQAAADAAGSAPISADLRSRVMAALETISA